MNSWISEHEYRESSEQISLAGLTLNVAFLHEIKQDSNEPEESIVRIGNFLNQQIFLNLRLVVDQLSRLRDELKAYFALEEFYGYFESARETNPKVCTHAEGLRRQHETLFLEVCELVEMAEAAFYNETAEAEIQPAITAGFQAFVQNFRCHEQEELELMMRLCNEDIGVGD